MKAVLLAAGTGERLGGISRALPKPMICLDGKPILEHNLELCRAHGVRELFINVHHLSEAITNHFGDGSKWGVSITYAYEPVLLGTAGGVKNLADHLGASPFFVVYGDNWTHCDLSALLRMHGQRSADLSLAVFATDAPGAGGLVAMETDGRITGFVERRTRATAGPGLINAGVYVLESSMVSLIDNGFSDFGHDVIPKLIQAGRRVFGFVMDHEVRAVDTPALYEKWADRR